MVSQKILRKQDLLLRSVGIFQGLKLSVIRPVMDFHNPRLHSHSQAMDFQSLSFALEEQNNM